MFNNRIIYITAFVLFFLGCSGYRKVQTDMGKVKVQKNALPLITQLLKTDFSRFKDHPIQVFFDSLNHPFVNQYIYQEPIYVARYLATEYPDNIFVDIYVNKHEHTRAFDTTMSWNIQDFKKDELYSVKIMYNDVCIKKYP